MNPRSYSPKALIPPLLLCVCIVAAGFVTSPWLVNYADEPYQILNGMDWQGVPMAPLSAIVTGWIGSAVEWQWLPFKLICWLALALSVVIAGTACYALTKRPVLSLWATAIGLAAAWVCRYWETLYGWDTFTTPLITLIAALTLYGWQRRGFSPALIAALAVLIAAAIGFRLPNLAALPVVVAAIACRHQWRAAACLLVGTTALTATLYLSLYGSPSGYLATVRANAMGNHSLHTLIGSGVYTAKMGMFFTVTWLVALAAIKLCRKPLGTRLLPTLDILMLWVVAMVWVKASVYVLMPGFNPVGVPYTSLAPCSAIFALLIAIALKCRHLRGACLILAAMALVPAAGSNLGVSKTLTFSLIPLIAALSTPLLRSRSAKVWVAIMAVVTLAACGGYKAAVWLDDFGGVDFRSQATESTHPRLKGVKLPPAKVDEIAKVCARYASLRANADTVVFVGDNNSRFLYHYLFDLTDHPLRHAWGMDHACSDTIIIEWERQLAATHPRAAFIHLSDSTLTILRPQ